MRSDIHPLERTDRFCKDNNLRVPILLSPMAGACPPALSIAVSRAGGMGACGVLLMQPESIEQWMQEFRSSSSGPLMLNNWIPDPIPTLDLSRETAVRKFLEHLGPEIPKGIEKKQPLDFESQCEAMLKSNPDVISSIMGLFEAGFIKRMKDAGIKWYATVTTVREAIQAENAGADGLVAQGMEAGGHRGTFDAASAAERMIGLTSLIPGVVDAVNIPVVATGGIADGRGLAASLALGASAVQIGTGFLRCPEAGIPAVWADAIGLAQPEDTIGTRAFSGRYGRSLRTFYTELANQPDSPEPSPYPIQRALTQPMRDQANRTGDIDRMQAWAGQSSGLAKTKSPIELIPEIWSVAQQILGQYRS